MADATIPSQPEYEIHSRLFVCPDVVPQLTHSPFSCNAAIFKPSEASEIVASFVPKMSILLKVWNYPSVECHTTRFSRLVSLLLVQQNFLSHYCTKLNDGKLCWQFVGLVAA